MAVKKSELKELVQSVWNEKLYALRKERGEKARAHQVEALTPYKELLVDYFEKDKERIEAYNKIQDAFEENGVRNYHFNYRKTSKFDDSLEANLEYIASDFYNGTVKGLEAVIKPYEDKIREINTSYGGVMTNLKNLSPKKGFEYLLQLGFDLTALSSNESSVPMIVVDPESLDLPK